MEQKYLIDTNNEKDFIFINNLKIVNPYRSIGQTSIKLKK